MRRQDVTREYNEAFAKLEKAEKEFKEVEAMLETQLQRRLDMRQEVANEAKRAEEELHKELSEHKATPPICLMELWMTMVYLS